MQHVTEVHGDVAGVGVDRDDGLCGFVAGPQRVRRAEVRARDEVQLAGLGRGPVELDPDRDAGAQHRMTAEAAVAVPREVGQARRHLRVLDDDAVPVEAVGLRDEPVATEGAEAAQPGIVTQPADELRPLAHVDEPAAHLGPVGLRRPPRSPVVAPRLGPAALDLGDERRDLLGGEDAADVEEAVGLEELAHGGVAVVERERARQVGARVALELEDRAIRIQRAQRRLPALEPPEVTARHLDHPRVEEAEARAQLVGEVGEGLARQLDQRVGRGVGRPDLDAVGAGDVGVRSAIRHAEADGPHAGEIGGGRPRTVAGSHPGGQLHAVELVEVDGRQLERGHAVSLAERVGLGQRQSEPVRANVTIEPYTARTFPEYARSVAQFP